MNLIKIYILEDEIITQELLKQTLESLDFSICGMATNAVTALEEIQELKPDIALLDIKVDGTETGIWLGNQLDIPIIYLTAYNDANTIKYAIYSKPVSYLVKPFNNDQLYIAMQLAIDKIKSNTQIVVKERDKNTIVLNKDILFAKKEDQYLKLFLADCEKLIRSSVNEFLELINSSDFLQVHRSYIVNMNHITTFTSKEITINNYKIPVSKKFAKDVIDGIN